MFLKEIVILSVLFALAVQINIIDESFVRFCGKVGNGSPISGSDLEGLTCVVRWKMTANEDEIENLCKSLGPYPLKNFKIVDGNKPECTYENVYTCKPSYTQINGYCYRIMSDKLISYKEAEQLCSSEKTKLEISGKEVTSTIVDLFDEDLIRLFELFWYDMKSIWIQPKNDFKDIVEYNGDSPNYAIIYGMAVFYSIGPKSLIKMPTNHRAQAMCFYRPEETPRSFGYKAAKLAKYYWPTLKRGLTTVWRTSGLYNYWMQEQSKDFAINQCKSSMAAIAGNTEIDVFNPTKENMKLLREDTEVKQSFIKAYSPTYLCCNSNGHQSKIVHFSKSYAPFNCESNTILVNMNSDFYSFRSKSHAGYCKDRVGTFLTFSESVNGLDNFEVYNRQEAPLLCSIYFKEIKMRTKCPDQWKKYVRESGRVVCHRFFSDYKNFEGAQRGCRSEGAELATYTTQEEFNLLRHNYGSPWIGGRKKSICKRRADSGECTKENMVIWDSPGFEHYSDKVRQVIGAGWVDPNPDNLHQNEYCIHIDGGTLNDIDCVNRQFTFNCIRDADY